MSVRCRINSPLQKPKTAGNTPMQTATIGAKIATARKKRSLSQAGLAQHMFITPQAVGKWERGEAVPDIVTMNRLAEVLGVDLNYFSESFPSAATDSTIPANGIESPAEAKTGKADSPLSWDMSRGNWVDADFSGLKNLQQKFSGSNLQNCLFVGSDMSGLALRGNHIHGCDFSNSDISGSHIHNSHLGDNLFGDCLLKGAEFSRSHIKGCNFSRADLSRAAFKGCSLEKNTLTGAVLHHTSFIDTAFNDTVFEGALDDCYFENCAFSKVTFQDCTLTNTFFKGRKLKGIRFVNCTADRLTAEFLKAGKADLSGLTVVTDLVVSHA